MSLNVELGRHICGIGSQKYIWAISSIPLTQFIQEHFIPLCHRHSHLAFNSLYCLLPPATGLLCFLFLLTRITILSFSSNQWLLIICSQHNCDFVKQDFSDIPSQIKLLHSRLTLCHTSFLCRICHKYNFMLVQLIIWWMTVSLPGWQAPAGQARSSFVHIAFLALCLANNRCVVTTG